MGEICSWDFPWGSKSTPSPPASTLRHKRQPRAPLCFLWDKQAEFKMLWRIIKVTCSLASSKAWFHPGVHNKHAQCVYWKMNSCFFSGGRGCRARGRVTGWEHLSGQRVRTSHLMGERKCVPTHFCSWLFSLAFTLGTCCRPQTQASHQSVWFVFSSLSTYPKP